jgi:hypothetical protein
MAGRPIVESHGLGAVQTFGKCKHSQPARRAPAARIDVDCGWRGCGGHVRSLCSFRTYAENYNPGPIFLVTGIGKATTRTLTVKQGMPILFPIDALEDTEGPNGISPPLIPASIPSYGIPPGTYAGEVRKVLEDSTNVVLKVDGKMVENLQESIITDFSAGVVAAGSEGQVFFTGRPGLPVGLELFSSGTEGYWVIIEGLSLGTHTISAQATHIAPDLGCPQPCTSSHTDYLNVTAPNP